jgi:hypothetical protein
MKYNELLHFDEYLDGLETVSIHPFTSLYHTASIVPVRMLSVATEPLNIYLCHGIQIAFFLQRICLHSLRDIIRDNGTW